LNKIIALSFIALILVFGCTEEKTGPTGQAIASAPETPNYTQSFNDFLNGSPFPFLKTMNTSYTFDGENYSYSAVSEEVKYSNDAPNGVWYKVKFEPGIPFGETEVPIKFLHQDAILVLSSDPAKAFIKQDGKTIELKNFNKFTGSWNVEFGITKQDNKKILTEIKIYNVKEFSKGNELFYS